MDSVNHQLWKELFSRHKVSSRIAEIASKEDGEVFQLDDYGEIRVSTKKASLIGENYMSDAYSMEIQLDNGNKYSAFVKVLPLNPVLRLLTTILKTYHREVRIYGHFLPALRAFQKENGISTGEYDIPAPEAYYLHSGDDVTDVPDGSSAVLVLEDLKRSGFRMIDKKVGCDYDHARLALQALANYHASSLGFMRHRKLGENQENFPSELRFLMKEVFYTDEIMCEKIRRSSPLHLGILRASNLYEEADWFVKQLANLEDIMIFTEKLNECDSLPTFIHGDTWVNNIMYHYEDDQVKAARLVDWQIVRTGHPGTDIVYFFFHSTTGEVRKQHFHQLLQDYYNHFNKVLSLYDIHLENEGYSFDKFRSEVEKRLLRGMFIACLFLPMILDTKIADMLNKFENEESNELADASPEELIDRKNEKLRETVASDTWIQNKLLCQRVIDMVIEVKKVVENS